jgi:hypothetical protein
MDDFGFDQPQKNSKLIQFIEDLITADMTSPSYQSNQSVLDTLKAHPEDLPTVTSYLFSCLSLPAKDWRRINKALSLILTLLKSGSATILEDIRKKADSFKQLVEFFFIESRMDKGGVVRDKARMIFAILTNPNLLDSDRISGKDSKSWKAEEKPRQFEPAPVRREEVFREEPKKVSMFQGINVKSTGNQQIRKVEQDLLGDFTSMGKQEKSNGVDLLMMNDENVSVGNTKPQTLAGGLEGLIDFSGPPVNFTGPQFIDITFEAPPTPAKSEIQNPENKKVSCNIGEQGPSLLSLKSMPSVQKPSPISNSSKSGPIDLESKLLSFDILEQAPKEEKPKGRSIYY